MYLFVICHRDTYFKVLIKLPIPTLTLTWWILAADVEGLSPE